MRGARDRLYKVASERDRAVDAADQVKKESVREVVNDCVAAIMKTKVHDDVELTGLLNDLIKKVRYIDNL